MTEERTNICCPHILVVECHDTDENSHLVCNSHYSPMIIDKWFVLKYCMQESFKQCPLLS
jgi:hypothetical protein